MKLICIKDSFKKAVSISEKISSKQTTLPILNNIFLEALKSGLKITATNLEIGIVINIGAKVEETGKITIPAKLINNLINNIQEGGNLSIQADNNNLIIKAGSSKAVIKGLPADEFPIIPEKKADFQLNSPNKKLKEVLNKTLIAASFNETRPELMGVNVIFTEKELFFAATDSFRLSENRLALTADMMEKDQYRALISKKSNILIPAATIAELSRIIMYNDEEGVTRVAIEDGQIFFDISGIRLVSRLINGKYPEYKHIIPKEFKTRAVVNTEDLQKTVRMASIFSPGKTGEIVLKIDSEKKKITVEAKNVEVGENTIEHAADITGPSQEAIFNAKYLLDGLSILGTAEVVILINSATSPVALKGIAEKDGKVAEDHVYIVMPIKN